MNWRKTEEIVRSLCKGRFTKASGSTHGDVDVISDEYAIEVKSTGKPRFRVTKSLLDKLWNNAIVRGLTPLLIIFFNEDMYIFILKRALNKSNKNSVSINIKNILDKYYVHHYILERLEIPKGGRNVQTS